MNREFKFRVWEIDRKCWANMAYIECCGNELKHLLFCDKPDKYIIQQFTGLKDKNNKEIYEDDIIKCSEIDSSSPTTGKRTVLQSFIAVVTWNKTLLGYYYNPISGTGYNNPHQGLCYAYNIEVIGNIFETPELLKNE